MASIKPYRDKWRAHVYVKGQRASKTFPTRRRAEEWAERAEISKGRGQQLGDIRDHNLLQLIPRKMREALLKTKCTPLDVHDMSFPVSVVSGIYFLLRDGEVTYIGQTENVLARVLKHMREGRKFEAFSFIPCSMEQLNELEQTYITAFMPDENKRLF